MLQRWIFTRIRVFMNSYFFMFKRWSPDGEHCFTYVGTKYCNEHQVLNLIVALSFAEICIFVNTIWRMEIG